MSVRVLYDSEHDMAALYCSTSEVAFGPLFHDANDRQHDADERAEAFLRWLQTCETWKDYAKVVERTTRDARMLTDAGLLQAYADWSRQEAIQWRDEDERDRVKYQD